VSWPQWQDLAAAAEEHGFNGLYRSDHYLSERIGSNRDSLDAWGTICALAAVTSRIRLGTLVSPAGFRHPSVLAKLVVTADQVSGGRIELGMGIGWFEEEHLAYGFGFGAPGRGWTCSESRSRSSSVRGAQVRSRSAAGTTGLPTSTPGRNRSSSHRQG